MQLHQQVSRRAEELDADRLTAWSAVCALERWACLESELPSPPRPGDAGVVLDDSGIRRAVTIEDVEPGRRLTWRWRPIDDDDDGETCVEVTLDDADAAGDTARTRVTVVEMPVRVIRAIGDDIPGLAPASGPVLVAA